MVLLGKYAVEKISFKNVYELFPRTNLIMAINKCNKHFNPWKNKIFSLMTMSKKGQSATLGLFTYELFLTIGPRCPIITDVKAKWDHYTSKKPRYNHFTNYRSMEKNY